MSVDLLIYLRDFLYSCRVFSFFLSISGLFPVYFQFPLMMSVSENFLSNDRDDTNLLMQLYCPGFLIFASRIKPHDWQRS